MAIHQVLLAYQCSLKTFKKTFGSYYISIFTDRLCLPNNSAKSPQGNRVIKNSTRLCDTTITKIS